MHQTTLFQTTGYDNHFIPINTLPSIPFSIHPAS
jgi:hypothetical protein